MNTKSFGGAALTAVLAFAAGCTKEHIAEETPCEEQSGIGCIWAGQTNALGLNGDGKDRRDTMLYWPIDMEFAPDGTPWVLDWNNHLIRKVNADQTFTTVVGSFLGDGAPDGSDATEPGAPGLEVNLNHPTDIVFRDDNTMIFASWHNHKIRKVDVSTGNVVILYGKNPAYGGDGGTAADVRLNQPSKLALDASGALYIVDQRNFRVRKISADSKTIETIAGNGTKGFAGDAGPAKDAQVEFEAGPNPEPSGAVAVRESDGAVFIADTLNHRIRMVDKDGVIATIAGTGEAGFSGDGGKATAAQLDHVKDLELGPDGRLYLADANNNRIRAINLETGIIETVAGSGVRGSAEADGVPALELELYRPLGIAFDKAGALYISDTHNSRIIKVPR
jgi:sugar lactone lactonase YvrE